MRSAFIKGPPFGDTKEWFFEAWKRSHMGCSALLCCRFVDFQESRFQDSKRQNIDSAVLEVTVLLIFTNSVFVLQNIQIWTVSNWMVSI